MAASGSQLLYLQVLLRVFQLEDTLDSIHAVLADGLITNEVAEALSLIEEAQKKRIRSK